MAYLDVPKDIEAIESKSFFGLTKKQLKGACIGLLCGLPAYFTLYKLTNSVDISMIGLMIVAFPPLFLGIYNKNGIPAEEIFKEYLKFNYVRPKKRIYKRTTANGFLERGVKKSVENSSSNQKNGKNN